MQTKLDKIDQLNATFKKMLPMKQEFQSELNKKFRLEFNYNSNHIEGSTLTYSETELLLIFDDTSGNHTMREFEEMKAHDVAYHLVEEWAGDEEHPLTEQNIKNLNEVILVRPFWKEAVTPDGQSTRRQIKAGDYKEFPNSVRLQNGELFQYASPTETPILMYELIEWYRKEKDILHPLTLAAMLHYKFVRIHPFDDGNGRIARLLLNYVLLRNGFPPIIIKSKEKQNYLTVLHRADIGIYEPLIDYMADQLIWSLETSIKAAKGESVEEADDLDKKISVLSKELEANDPDEDVQVRFSKEEFIKIYKTWFSELMRSVIPKVQKFNKFFTGTNHNINIMNTLGFTQFIDEPADEILERLFKNFEANNSSFQTYEAKITFYTSYGTLIKGGLKTFGCNYGFEIKFDSIKYEVLVDEFTENNNRTQIKKVEKLLHKPLSSANIDDIVSTLTNSIYEHIDFNSKKNGLR